MRRLSLILTFLALAVIAAGVAPVRAQDEAARARPLVQRFATDNFNEIAAAVAALSGSGLAQAAPVIEALRDGRLAYRPADRGVYIRSAAGTWSVAATGEPAAAPEGARPVRL
ncbi:urea ABC transporter permease subunit UrtB, partial [Phreatobacter sp. AB_2022a]|nr:urea ABC transporter permease subunit UrtB [Phreatobacter sp. AB_2022a]